MLEKETKEVFEKKKVCLLQQAERLHHMHTYDIELELFSFAFL